MSWDGYVTQLKSPNVNGDIPVAEVAIWGKQSGQESQWAASPGLSNITAEEIKVLNGDRNAFHVKGPVIAGKKCMFLNDETKNDKSYCMNLRTRQDAEGETYSICIAESKLAYIILLGTKGANSGQLTNKVYETVKHLWNSNM